MQESPPPLSSTERPFECGALWAPSSTRAVAPQLAPAVPRAGKHSVWGPFTCPEYAPSRGKPDPAHVAAPPVPDDSQGVSWGALCAALEP